MTSPTFLPNIHLTCYLEKNTRNIYHFYIFVPVSKHWVCPPHRQLEYITRLFWVRIIKTELEKACNHWLTTVPS